MTQKIVLITGGATWTPPSDAIGANAKIVCFGAGANGTVATCVGAVGAGGMSGGVSVKNSFSITSGSPISIQIPAANSVSTCWFNSTGTVFANSGAAGGAAGTGDLARGGNIGSNGAPCVAGGGGGGAPAEAGQGSAGTIGGGGASGSGAGPSTAGTEYSITAGGTAGAGGGANPANGPSPSADAGLYGAGGGGNFPTGCGATPGGLSTQGAIIVIYTAVGLTSVSPNTGGIFGGTSITISGQGFTGATSVTLGGTSCTGVVVVNDNTITATSGGHASGIVDCVVTAPAGTITGTNVYTYSTVVSSVSPNNGLVYGGRPVTVNGTGFTNATSTTLGGSAITSFVEVSDTIITGVTPTHAAGLVDAVVTNGTFSATGVGEFTFTDAPKNVVAPDIINVKTRMVGY